MKKQTVIPLEQLEPNKGQLKWLPKNPRQWTQEQLDRLKGSICETPLLLEARGLIVFPRSETRYVVIGGNMRLAALRELGYTEAPCYVLPADTTPDKVKEIAIKDNGQFGEWDVDAIMESWNDFTFEDFNLSQWAPGGKAQQSSGGGGIDPEALPEELRGVDIDPAKMEDLQGDDETAKERVIITYIGDERKKVEELLGVSDISSKIVWRLEEIIKMREGE